MVRIITLLLALFVWLHSNAASLSHNHRLFDPTYGYSSPAKLCLSFSSDEVAIASPTSPVFLRFHLENGVRLCQTLVDIESSELGHHPIHLALFKRNQNDITIAANTSAVSIVRWREGESEIWLKFTQSSSQWLQGPGGFQAPNAMNDVQVCLGGIAFMDTQILELLHSTNHSNLPYNQDTSSGEARSTLLCLDHSQSMTPDDPVSISAISYILTQGVTTYSDPATIEHGDLFTLTIPTTRGLGYPKPFELTSMVSTPGPVSTGYFFPWNAIGNAPFQVSFMLEGNTSFHASSQLTIDSSSTPHSGFPLGARYTHHDGREGYLIPGLEFVIENGVDGAGFAYCLDADGTVSIEGIPHATKAYVEYDGSSVFPFDHPLRIQGSIVSNHAQTIQVELELATSTQPYPYRAGSGLWSNTQFYCPGILRYLWQETRNLAVIQDFGPHLEQWPSPNHVNDLLMLMFHPIQ